MADQFCRKWVDDLFTKYDTDRSNVLQRRQLKLWLQKQVKEKPLHKKVVTREFNKLMDTADTNGDGKLDRWELYQYCVKAYQQNN